MKLNMDQQCIFSRIETCFVRSGVDVVQFLFNWGLDCNIHDFYFLYISLEINICKYSFGDTLQCRVCCRWHILSMRSFKPFLVMFFLTSRSRRMCFFNYWNWGAFWFYNMRFYHFQEIFLIQKLKTVLGCFKKKCVNVLKLNENEKNNNKKKKQVYSWLRPV